MDEISKQSLDLHCALRGKIEVVARRHMESRQDLSLLYTPGPSPAGRSPPTTISPST